MSKNIGIHQQKKILIAEDNYKQSVEITQAAINNGFLKQFTGAQLGIFLYLITNLDKENSLHTNPTIIAGHLSDSYHLEDIKKGLNSLEKNDIIDVSTKRKGNYTYHIKINMKSLEKLMSFSDFKDENTKKTKELSTNFNLNKYYNQVKLRRDSLDNPSPERDELFLGLLTFVTPDSNIEIVETEICKWLEFFDTQMIKELIRRVDKWIEKYNNPPEEAYSYLKGIIDDWYQKEISSYDKLQHFDRLYRETRELAETYGFQNWHNIKPAHMETFQNWLNDGFPLSLSIIKFAIKEAFKRKSDGQPSLNYIESNFIKTFKQNKCRNIEEAHSCVNKNSKTVKGNFNYKGKTKKHKKNLKTKKWQDLYWDFELNQEG